MYEINSRTTKHNAVALKHGFLNHSTLPPLLINGDPNIAHLIDAMMHYQSELMWVEGCPTKLVAIQHAEIGRATLVLDVDVDSDIPEQRIVHAEW